MDADERDIYNFLKTFPGEFISVKEISRRAGGKYRYREDADWAAPVLLRLVEAKLIETDSTNHYRFPADGKAPKSKKKWIAPHIKKILESSGKLTNLDEE